MRFGEVCDVSVLGDRESFEFARKMTNGGELYIPSTTYSWLARDKLISVRGHAISYSLVSQFVRDGKILAVSLPEHLDELSRRLLFEVEREVPLTDLRGMLLATHLKVPFLSLDGGTAERLQDCFEVRALRSVAAPSDWRSYKGILNYYQSLAAEVGEKTCECLENGGSFKDVANEFNGGGACAGNGGESGLEFEYLLWNIVPVLREYFKERVFQPDIVRELCKQTLLLVASPIER